MVFGVAFSFFYGALEGAHKKMLMSDNEDVIFFMRCQKELHKKNADE